MNEIINFDYPINRCRNNTKQSKGKDKKEIHRGMALGLVNLRPCNAVKNNNKPQQNCKKLELKKYQKIFKITNEWFLKTYPYYFDYTTIQYNKNNKCAKHKDSKNIGESIICGLGDYEGGRLIIYDYMGKDKVYINIKNRFFKFNGSQYAHETEPFTGNRITLVFFNIN
jgi:predicted 2-oxoglutarate/Fe(II)-dependent dioxygenase YbiX